MVFLHCTETDIRNNAAMAVKFALATKAQSVFGVMLCVLTVCRGELSARPSLCACPEAAGRGCSSTRSMSYVTAVSAALCRAPSASENREGP